MYKSKTHFHDPFDVFRWVGDEIKPITFERGYRHPQGWHVGHFRLNWDGYMSNIIWKCHSRYFSCSITNRYKWQKYGYNSNTCNLARLLIMELPHRTELFHIAQDLILGKALYSHILGSEWGFSNCGQGNIVSYARLDNDKITVKRSQESDTFYLPDVVRSIKEQLLPESKQLKLLI